MKRDDEVDHQPIHDPNINDTDRANMRAERAERAEARLKQQEPPKKTKKRVNNSTPLKGPNSENLMRWTAG